MRPPPLVAVIGAADATPDALATAEAVGRGVAVRGWTLVTGGRTGVMEAASRGASEAGGLVVGILPGPDARDANPWVAIPIPTGLGNARNAVIAQAAAALVAISGGYGTLSEIALARKNGKPVAAIGSWDVPGVPSFATAGEALAQLDSWLASD